jgi:hypothetical protein
MLTQISPPHSIHSSFSFFVYFIRARRHLLLLSPLVSFSLYIRLHLPDPFHSHSVLRPFRLPRLPFPFLLHSPLPLQFPLSILIFRLYSLPFRTSPFHLSGCPPSCLPGILGCVGFGAVCEEIFHSLVLPYCRVYIFSHPVHVVFSIEL